MHCQHTDNIPIDMREDWSEVDIDLPEVETKRARKDFFEVPADAIAG